MTLKRAFLTLAILWTLGIMAICWIPMSLLAPDDGSGGGMFDIPYFDKVVHFGIFLGFAVLWHLATTGSRHSLQIIVSGIGLAILTEVVQKLPIVGRQSDIDDAACDIAGVLLGTLIMRRIAATSTRKSTASLAESTV